MLIQTCQREPLVKLLTALMSCESLIKLLHTREMSTKCQRIRSRVQIYLLQHLMFDIISNPCIVFKKYKIFEEVISDNP